MCKLPNETVVLCKQSNEIVVCQLPVSFCLGFTTALFLVFLDTATCYSISSFIETSEQSLWWILKSWCFSPPIWMHRKTLNSVSKVIWDYIWFAFLYFALWLVQKTRMKLFTNQMWNWNQSPLDRLNFPT